MTNVRVVESQCPWSHILPCPKSPRPSSHILSPFLSPTLPLPRPLSSPCSPPLSLAYRCWSSLGFLTVSWHTSHTKLGISSLRSPTEKNTPFEPPHSPASNHAVFNRPRLSSLASNSTIFRPAPRLQPRGFVESEKWPRNVLECSFALIETWPRNVLECSRSTSWKHLFFHPFPFLDPRFRSSPRFAPAPLFSAGIRLGNVLRRRAQTLRRRRLPLQRNPSVPTRALLRNERAGAVGGTRA